MSSHVWAPVRPVAARIAARFAGLSAVLLLVSVAVFSLVDLLPGDAATVLLPPGTAEDTSARLRDQLGLDLPPVTRFFHWLSSVVHGDLGVTYATGEPVIDVLRRTAVVTFELMVMTQLLAMAIGVLVGVFAARRAGTSADRVVQSLAFGAVALPQFAVALVLLVVFAVHLHWFPAVGYVPFGDDPLTNLRGFVLPATTLAIPVAATYARLLRVELAATLASDHVLLARGLGVPERRVMLRHALRPSLSGLVAVAATQTAALLGGAVIVESIFALPGIGRLLITSVGRREYSVVQAATLLIATGFVTVNAAIDALRVRLDPRIATKRP